MFLPIPANFRLYHFLLFLFCFYHWPYILNVQTSRRKSAVFSTPFLYKPEAHRHIEAENVQKTEHILNLRNMNYTYY